MNRVLLHGVLLFALLGTSFGARPAQADDAASPHPEVSITADGLTLEWRAIWPTVVTAADGSASVSLAGFQTLNNPGQPRVPFASALVALPPEAKPTLVIDSLAENTLSVPGPLTLAPQPSGVRRNSAGEAIGAGYAEAEPVAFAPEVVELAEIGVVRGVRLARVTFYPVRPEADALRVTTEVRATLRFNAHFTMQNAPSDALTKIVAAAVVNPEQMQAAAPEGGARVEGFPQAIGSRALIEVMQTGLTTITYAALSAAGFPVAGTDPANLSLTRAGAEIAMEWEGDGDAAFEPGERFLFFASPRFNRYSVFDVYALTDVGTPGLRMTARSAAPGGLLAGTPTLEAVFETNALYTPECYCAPIPAGRDGDRWTWDVLRLPDRSTLTFPFSLSAANTAQPATLTVWFIGYTDVAQSPDHRVTVSVNNTALGTTEWNGKQAITYTVSIPAGLLVNGSNSLKLSLPGLAGVAVEGAWFDAFAVRYSRSTAASGDFAAFSGEVNPRAYTVNLANATGLRAYDVTSANTPVRLTNLSGSTFGDPGSGLPRQYALTNDSGLLAPARVRLPVAVQNTSGARYLIITHPTLTAQLAPLVSLRQSQGLSVAVENVQAIYDAFDGRPTPEAIRAYLANAYAAWNPQPDYVLLVGDGTVDPKRYRAESFTTYLPPYLEVVDPWAGETAADNRYVTVDGADILPDILLGRLPVNTPAEAAAVVSKLVQYETVSPVGLWNAAVPFTSDNADQAGNFPAQSQMLAATRIAPPYTAPQIVVSDPMTNTRQAVLARWNAGAGTLVYNGHASIHQWAAERAFHIDDVPTLTNGSRMPVVLQMTCFTGSFHLSGLSALDEALLRQPGAGAVAVFGPTGLGVSTGHEALANAYLGRVYGNGQPEVGAATLAGRLAVAANGYALDLIDTFVLLGDPATRTDVTIDPGFPIFLPIIRR